MLTVFFNIVSIFIMVLIGFVACKKGVLPFEANDHLVKMLLTICLPCMIVSSMSTRELSDTLLTQILQMIVGSAAYFILGAVVSYFVVKMIRYKPIADQGVLMVILTSVNSGFMGFPITKAIFGNDCFFLMVISNAILTAYLYSILFTQLNVGHEKAKFSLKEFFRPFANACMYATVLGFILLFGHIKLPAFLSDLLGSIGDVTTPISMFVVGIQLAQSNFRKLLTNGKLIYISLCNVILMPALTFLAVNWLPWEPTVKAMMVFSVAFPSAVITVALASRENKNAALMAEGVALTTLFSMATIPLIAAILLAVYF